MISQRGRAERYPSTKQSRFKMEETMVTIKSFYDPAYQAECDYFCAPIPHSNNYLALVVNRSGRTDTGFRDQQLRSLKLKRRPK